MYREGILFSRMICACVDHYQMICVVDDLYHAFIVLYHLS